ncbi:Protein C34B2.8 [Aphelenchoides avenae]|nr:Protein C34B2.8 [Aphelenchus avenae]
MENGPPKQDMPPPGGYQKFNWNRTYAKAIWKPHIILPGAVAVAVYGLFQAKAQQRMRFDRVFEDQDLRNAMEPFLTAERDRMFLKILNKNRDMESEVMKNVPGWKTGTWYGEPVYFTLGDKWWDPLPEEFYAHSPKKNVMDEILWRHHGEYSAPKFYDKWIPEFIAQYIW